MITLESENATYIMDASHVEAAMVIKSEFDNAYGVFLQGISARSYDTGKQFKEKADAVACAKETMRLVMAKKMGIVERGCDA